MQLGKAKTYCNSLKLAGKDDWRLPDFWELQSIVNYDKKRPAIDTTYFHNTTFAEYWSSTVDGSTVRTVEFKEGIIFTAAKSDNKNVRCVRGSQLPAIDLLDNQDGTVTDRSTSLTWQQKSDNTKRKWKDALAYCEGLELPAKSGQKDWRLPNIRELNSIVDKSKKSGPTINTTFFLETKSDSYWSSTITSWHTVGVFIMGFDDGEIGYYGRTYSNYVRCVRGGQ